MKNHTNLLLIMVSWSHGPIFDLASAASQESLDIFSSELFVMDTAGRGYSVRIQRAWWRRPTH